MQRLVISRFVAFFCVSREDSYPCNPQGSREKCEQSFEAASSSVGTRHAVSLPSLSKKSIEIALTISALRQERP